MKLIDLLVQRAKSGKFTWPNGASLLFQGATGIVYCNGIISPSTIACRLDVVAENTANDYVTREQYETALIASQKVEWDGTGLPPTGCEFEYLASQGRWLSATMNYCGKAFAIIETDGMETWLRLAGIEVRTIRSEADKKRDEISSQINAAADASGTLGSMIYDAIAAGKIPGVRIE